MDPASMSPEQLEELKRKIAEAKAQETSLHAAGTPPMDTTGTVAADSTGKKIGVVLIVIVGSFLGVMGWVFWQFFKVQASGSAQISGPAFGNVTVQVSHCRSGWKTVSTLFPGAELEFSQYPNLTVQVDGQDQNDGGAIAHVVVAEKQTGGSDAKTVDFTPNQCTTLQGSVKRSDTNTVNNTNNPTNDTWTASGTVNADCQTPAGDRLQLHADFKNCGDSFSW